jgi:short-subunit dehydrogenase
VKKKIAIVTGATGGLGKEFVKLLCNEDVDEIWAVARNVKKLDNLRDELGSMIVPISMDLAKDESYQRIKELLCEQQPQVQYLINNAGGGRMDPSISFSDEYIETGITTHCIAVAVLCNSCIPYMSNGSHIINMASQSAFQPVPYINLYAASKAFVYSYSRALNIELKGTGISVTVACPGWTKTDLLEKERNGQEVKFPGMAMPDAVAAKTLADAKKCKDITVYGPYVKYMHLLAKLFPHRMVMKSWLRSIKDYI